MKSFIARYFKTAGQAIRGYEKLSKEKQVKQRIVEINGSFFIMGKEQIKALKQ